MNIKNILLSALLSILLTSCEKDVPVQPAAEKYAEPALEISVIPDRIQFGFDKIYHFRIAFDTNYYQEDGFIPYAYFISGTEIVELPLYDDGFSDDSLRNDLAASNNIWTGGINSKDFPAEGEWTLHLESYLFNELIETYQPITGIVVKNNTPPVIEQITGISESDTLRSGFSPFPVVIDINDPDNDESGYNDNQTLRLEIRNRDNIPKDYEFVRTDPLSDMVISLDSTIAAGLRTNDRYKLTFIASDLYGEKDSLSLDNVRIENTAPTVYNLVYPDTVFVPRDTEYFVDFAVQVNANDPQGHLEYQDVDSVKITTVSTRLMRDDGEDLDVSENDGRYTAAYTVNSSFFTEDETELPFKVQIRDKAGNTGNELTGKFIFIKVSKSETKEVVYEKNNNYFNPFNTK